MLRTFWEVLFMSALSCSYTAWKLTYFFDAFRCLEAYKHVLEVHC